MKNKLIVMGIVALTSNAIAETNTNKFYIKGSLGLSSFNEAKENIGSSEFPLSIKTLDQESKISPNGSISFGYYINENVRTDLTIGYDSVSFKNKSYYVKPGEVPVDNGDDAANYNYYIKIKRKASIPSIMVNVISDMPLNDNVGLFIGFGCGMARINQEIEFSNGGIGIYSQKEVLKSDTNNFAYNFTVGSSFKVGPASKLDIAYVWKNFGHSKSVKDSDGYSTSEIYYKGHSVNLGIRLDI